MKKKYLTLATLLSLSCSALFAQVTVTFNYTGAVQAWTVPSGVTQVTVNVLGAEGNANSNGDFLPGKGGQVTGTLLVTACQVLDIYVGGGGLSTYPADTNGGWNGGGGAGASYFDPNWGNPICYSAYGGGGGGGSDIRVSPYALANREVVAGGGGGTGGDRISCCGPGAGGGGGGGYYGGGGGGGYSGLPGTGGTQAAGGAGGLSPGCSIFGGMPGDNGALGVGGIGGEAPANCQAGPNPGCQAGHGGAAVGQTGVNCTSGGCPGTWSGGSGGGGSNYTGGLSIVTSNLQGIQTGNGKITITYIPGIGGLTLTTTPTNPTCGSCNGSITVTPVGGSAPYTYNWTPNVSSTSTATALCAGNYTITVTDHCGNTASAAVTLVGNSITVNANNTGNETCNGSCVGSANVTVIGGTPPLTYAWTPVGGNGSSATALCAGTYTVSVSDHAGCTGTATVTITQPALLTAPIVNANILCAGGVGTATCNPLGGTPAYTYSWSTVPVQTGQTATGLSAGTYTVTVTDNNGCTASGSVTLNQPPLLTASMGAVTYPTCNGGTGTATVNAAGGTPAYTYAWTTLPVQTTQTATGLSAGNYTVTVTDHNGCTASASVLITQPSAVTANIGAITYPACNGGTGTATVIPGGGTPNYTYNWTPTGGINATGTGLIAGSYTVTVKDANGCTASASVLITQPALLAVSATFTHASCNLPNGSATALPTGGVGGYTYIWTPSSETTATITGLTAGIYTVNVKDLNGCSASTTVNVTQPPAVVASITGSTNVSCNGGNNGTMIGNGTGGSAPYNYIWAPGGNTNANATGLAAGCYTLTVSDANGCSSTAIACINEPTPLLVRASGPGLLCKDSTGTFTANASGGTAPYRYLWSNGASTSVASITPSNAQTYTVTVTDANGCIGTADVSISFGPPLTVTASGRTSLCGGSTTTLCAQTTGGTGGNNYLWQPGNLVTPCITITPTVTTTYTLAVTDNCGAVATSTITVNINPYPNIQLSADIYNGCAPLCIQFRNGATVQGGTAQYVWTFGTGDTAQEANPIYCYKKNGTFDVTLTATSDSGCSATLKKSGAISVYSRPVAAFAYSPSTLSSINPLVQFTNQSTDINGIQAQWWNFGDGSEISTEMSPSHTYQDTGSYCPSLVVMNEHGCTDTTTNCLVINPAYTLYIPSAFSPNGDGVNDVFQPVGKYIKSFEMYIFDRWGMQLYHTTDITKGWKGTVGGGSNVQQEDTYIYKINVTDAMGVSHSYVGNVSIIK